MRQAKIRYQNEIAGVLTETNEGDYIFQYTPSYVSKFPSQFLTFTMPVGLEAYHSDRLFPLFEGLIPEGWLLEIASKNWKINPRDRMGLLLSCCQNTIGAVSVISKLDTDE